MKRLILAFILTYHLIPAFAQYNCWIQFKDKSGTHGTFAKPSDYLSEEALARRAKQNIAIDSTDLPVCQTDMQSFLTWVARSNTAANG